MKAYYLGHVVFYVKNLEQALAFYRDIVGLQEVEPIFGGKAAALRSGRTHHELLLIEVGDVPGPVLGRRRGLYHIGVKIGECVDDLRAAKRKLDAAGTAISDKSDHTVSQSLYLQDTDGNEVGLYVDVPDVDWQRDPSRCWLPSNR